MHLTAKLNLSPCMASKILVFMNWCTVQQRLNNYYVGESSNSFVKVICELDNIIS